MWVAWRWKLADAANEQVVQTYEVQATRLSISQGLSILCFVLCRAIAPLLQFPKTKRPNVQRSRNKDTTQAVPHSHPLYLWGQPPG